MMMMIMMIIMMMMMMMIIIIIIIIIIIMPETTKGITYLTTDGNLNSIQNSSRAAQCQSFESKSVEVPRGNTRR
jgi:hypothetical protein